MESPTQDNETAQEPMLHTGNQAFNMSERNKTASRNVVIAPRQHHNQKLFRLGG